MVVVVDLNSVYDIAALVRRTRPCAIFYYADKHDKSAALLPVFEKLAAKFADACDTWATCLVSSLSSSRAALKINEVPTVWFCRDGAIQRVVNLPQAQLYVSEARSVFETCAAVEPTFDVKATEQLLNAGKAAAELSAKQWLAERPLVVLTIDSSSESLKKILRPEVILLDGVENEERYTACQQLLSIRRTAENALLVNGSLIEQFNDDLSDEAKKAIDENVARADLALVARCKAIINRAPIMVLMKGSRQAPYCKFAKRLVALLEEHDVQDWGCFDVFTDFAVRERVKTISNWPTYPQIYVNGNLIGGLDTLTNFGSELKSRLTAPPASSAAPATN